MTRPIIPTGLTVRDFNCPACGARPNRMCRWDNGKTKRACEDRYDSLFAAERTVREDMMDAEEIRALERMPSARIKPKAVGQTVL